MITRAAVETIATALAQRDLAGGLRWLAATYPGAVGLSTALGKEAQIIADTIWREALDIRVFTLDTGRLFEETYQLLEATRARARGPLEVYCPDTASVEGLLRAKGPFSFYRSLDDRLECCRIRKVEPLRRAVRGLAVWLTGVRAAHSDFRQTMAPVSWDAEHGLIRVHPLLRWSDAEVEAYIRRHDVPVNALHAQGYPSVGCAPCTRAVGPDEPARAGRWWWEASHRECGLHRR
jgi:phosphoadenosine phosphosulfate reductase